MFVTCHVLWWKGYCARLMRTSIKVSFEKRISTVQPLLFRKKWEMSLSEEYFVQMRQVSFEKRISTVQPLLFRKKWEMSLSEEYFVQMRHCEYDSIVSWNALKTHSFVITPLLIWLERLFIMNQSDVCYDIKSWNNVCVVCLFCKLITNYGRFHYCT